MPELSEHFDAVVGKSARKVWEAMDRPEEFPVIEMGAGRGTMARDLIMVLLWYISLPNLEPTATTTNTSKNKKER